MNTTTVKVPTKNLPRLRSELTKVNKTRAKKGLMPIEIREAAPDIEQVMAALAGVVQHVEMSAVTLTIPPRRLGDWLVLSKVRRVDDSIFIDHLVDEEIPKAYRKAHLKGGHLACEHCNYQRARAAAYILRHKDGGHYIQIGSTCIDKFTNSIGFLAQLNTAEATQATLGKAVVEAQQVQDRREVYLPLRPAVEAIMVVGGSVWDCAKASFAPDDVAKTKADEFIRWGRALDPAQCSDREHNIQITVAKDYLSLEDVWALKNAISTYHRALEIEIGRAQLGRRRFYGKEGDQTYTEAVEVVDIISFMGHWGPTNLYKFKTSGDYILTYFTGKRPWQVGDRPTLAFKIKKNMIYRKEYQTQIKGCKEAAL